MLMVEIDKCKRTELVIFNAFHLIPFVNGKTTRSKLMRQDTS